MVVKSCIKCGQLKPLPEFYPHPKMADGHLNMCKECARAARKAHRDANLEKYRKYDRDRGRLPHRVALGKRTKRARGQKEWAASNPEKRAVHIIVGHAIRDGKLFPQPCRRCSSTDRVHAHHEDYSKPLDVVWLCPPCHGERHRELNEATRSKRVA